MPSWTRSPRFVNNHDPKPELSAPHKPGIVDKTSAVEISLTVCQTHLKVSYQDSPNLVSWAYYVVVELLPSPAFLIVPIEVAIQNNDSDFSTKNKTVDFILAIRYYTYLEGLPICVTDDLLCEYCTAQAIREGELVSWRLILMSQCSAQTVEQKTW